MLLQMLNTRWNISYPDLSHVSQAFESLGDDWINPLPVRFSLQPVKADRHNSRFSIGTRGDISRMSLPCGKPQCLNKRLPKAIRSKVKPRCSQKKSLECAFCSSFKVKMPVLLKQALLQYKQISLAAARLVVAAPVLLFCQLLWL